MQNFRTAGDFRAKVYWDKRDSGIPGGVTIKTAELNRLNYLPAGTPIGLDPVTGLYRVMKIAKMQATATNVATGYQVFKGHHFKVGDIVTAKNGSKASSINSINTNNAGYDTLNLSATLGDALAIGDGLFLAAAVTTGTDSAPAFPIVGLVGDDFDITPGDNLLVDCWVHGMIRETALAFPVPAFVKTALPQIFWRS